MKNFKQKLTGIRWCCFVVAFALAIVTSGCTHRFAQSSFFQQTDFLKLILAHRTDKAAEFHSSFDISPEYAIKDFEVVLNIKDREREMLLNNIMAGCTNSVVQSGATITGHGGTSSLSEQDFSYETGTTVGQVRVYSTPIDDSKLKIVAVILECPKR